LRLGAYINYLASIARFAACRPVVTPVFYSTKEMELTMGEPNYLFLFFLKAFQGFITFEAAKGSGQIQRA